MEKREGRERRGDVNGQFIELFIDKSESDLIKLLPSDSANERTAAAVLLGNRKCVNAVEALCRQLNREKALYSKIAISEALGKIGEPAVSAIISLLGKIGTNRHISVPDGEFKKKSYPLPRDIAARTITKIGLPALKYLEAVIMAGSREVIAEALDAYGWIVFYNGGVSEKFIIEAYHKYADDELICWKIIRAMQAFNVPEITGILQDVVNTSTVPACKIEAQRSLKQIERRANKK
jgi:hypothetical protein